MKPIQMLMLALLLTGAPAAHAQVFSDDSQLGLEPTGVKCDSLSSRAGAVELDVRCSYAEGGALTEFLSKRDKACVDRELDALKSALADEKRRALLEKLKLSRIVLDFSDNSHAKVDDDKLEYGSFLGTALVRESLVKPGVKGRGADEFRFASYEKSLRGDEASKIGFEWKSYTDSTSKVTGRRDVSLNDKLVREGDGTTSCYDKCERPRTTDLVSCYHHRDDDRCSDDEKRDYDHDYYLPKKSMQSVADWVRLYPNCGQCYQGKTDTATVVTGRGHQRLETVMAVKFAMGSDGKCSSTIVGPKDFTDAFESWRKESERLEALEKVDLGSKAASAISVFGDSSQPARESDAPGAKFVPGAVVASAKAQKPAAGTTTKVK